MSVLGIAVLTVNVIDILRTVFDVGRGQAPVTGHVSGAIWRILLALRRRGLSHERMETLGVLAIVSVLATWVTFLFVGWTLVFHGSPGAAVLEATGAPAGLLDRSYLASGNLFGLSYGDVVAGSPGWRFTTVLAAANGGLVITLAITYLVPVATAAADRRRFARHIASLGRTPEGIVIGGARIGDPTILGDILVTINEPLASMGQRHLAYPVRHYFHPHNAENAITVSVAALDEALTLVEYGLQPDVRPPAALVEALRYNLDVFFETYPMEVDQDVYDVPDAPDLEILRRAGIPTVDDEEFAAALHELADHRRGICAVVHGDGWEWADVRGG
jgi:hypothetical protein